MSRLCDTEKKEIESRLKRGLENALHHNVYSNDSAVEKAACMKCSPETKSNEFLCDDCGRNFFAVIQQGLIELNRKLQGVGQNNHQSTNSPVKFNACIRSIFKSNGSASSCGGGGGGGGAAAAAAAAAAPLPSEFHSPRHLQSPLAAPTTDEENGDDIVVVGDNDALSQHGTQPANGRKNNMLPEPRKKKAKSASG